jgi:hypothetical protein
VSVLVSSGSAFASVGLAMFFRSAFIAWAGVTGPSPVGC